MDKTPLCIIAGRAGSKRLPGKNMLPIGGLPMVAHSVRQAVSSGLKDIAVTSDSDEILQAAKSAGANIIIKRPPELATDTATSFDVIKHAIDRAERLGTNYHYIVFLQITSPLRLAEDIRTAIQAFVNTNATNLISVNSVKNVIGQRQSAKAINGSIYIWNKKRFLEDSNHVYPDTLFLEMPPYRSIDIDYRVDYEIAKFLYEQDLYEDGESIIVK